MVGKPSSSLLALSAFKLISVNSTGQNFYSIAYCPNSGSDAGECEEAHHQEIQEAAQHVSWPVLEL